MWRHNKHVTSKQACDVTDFLIWRHNKHVTSLIYQNYDVISSMWHHWLSHIWRHWISHIYDVISSMWLHISIQKEI
jgi:hypothetical protein